MSRVLITVDVRNGGLLALLPFCFLFIGDYQLPIGGSELTVPLGMAIIAPVLVLICGLQRILIPSTALLMLGILFFGALGTLVTPEAGVARAAAGSMPLVYAMAVMVAYAQVRRRIDVRQALGWMLLGGLILALIVIVLSYIGLSTPGDYYDIKAFVETPLGRSNYLAAFLLFLFALSLPIKPLWAPIFAVAVLATLSRGGVLMLCLFLVAIPLARRRLLWLVWSVPLLGFLACMYLLVSGHYETLAQLAGPFENVIRSVFNRMLLWQFGFDLWWQNPVFGIGPNTFRTFVELNSQIEDVWGVHNSILQMLLNYGVFGTLLYGLYLRMIYRYLTFAERVDPIFWYLRVVFVVLMVFSLMEPLVGSAAFEVLLALLLVLAIARTKSTSRSEPI